MHTDFVCYGCGINPSDSISKYCSVVCASKIPYLQNNTSECVTCGEPMINNTKNIVCAKCKHALSIINNKREYDSERFVVKRQKI
jgi:hypothetical protein